MKLRFRRFVGRLLAALLFLLIAASTFTTLCPVGSKGPGPGVSGAK